MNKSKEFYKTNLEEQETIKHIDYFNQSVRCYTTRFPVYNRLKAKLGEPTHTYYTQGQISGAYWDIPFADKKRMNVVFSKTTIIGQY